MVLTIFTRKRHRWGKKLFKYLTQEFGGKRDYGVNPKKKITKEERSRNQ